MDFFHTSHLILPLLDWFLYILRISSYRFDFFFSRSPLQYNYIRIELWHLRKRFAGYCYRIYKERGEEISLNPRREPLRHDHKHFLPRQNFHYFRLKHTSAPTVPQYTYLFELWTTWFYPFLTVRGVLKDLFFRSSLTKILAHDSSDEQNI